MTKLEVTPENISSHVADWAEDFWDWACVVYSDENVQTLCLAMQNRFNCNVNFLLLAIWLGQRKFLIPKTGWGVLIKRTEKLRLGVRRLRDRRRKIKLSDREKYQELLDLELKGERLVQEKSLSILLSFNNSVLEKETVEPNLLSCVRALGGSRDAENEAKTLGVLVQNLSD